MESSGCIIRGLQSEIDLLKSELELLKSKLELLMAENTSLNEVNKSLLATNKSLIEEIAKLKEKLGLTSKNSSIPTSKELYKLKRNKEKSIRNRGAQPGHSSTTRSKLPADQVVDLAISAVCSCGGHVSVSPKPYIHQKIDLPDIKPHVIDYHLHHGRCRQCGKRYTATLPKGVTRDTFGPKIKAVIGSLTAFYKNSKREVSYILKDIFNLDISLGSISNSEARVAQKCQGAY